MEVHMDGIGWFKMFVFGLLWDGLVSSYYRNIIMFKEDDIYFAEFDESYLDDTADLLTRSFL